MISPGEAAERGGVRLWNVSPHPQLSSAVAPGPGGLPVTTAEAAVTALYQAHALGLTRLAHIRFSSSAGWQEVLWANADGSALVVTDPRGKQSQYGRGNILGVLSGNKLTPIPHSAYTVGKLAW